MADFVRTEVVNADVLAAQLGQASVAVAAFTNTTTRRYGQLMLTAVKGRASGRPGPRMITGDYNRSITLIITATAGSISASIGTNSPQGPRLEYGFASGISPQGGVDILGRHFEQPPFPHFGPAFDQVSSAYRAEMSRGVAAIVAGRGVS